MKYCSINGVQQSNVDVIERGLAYGDGLFTTAKIVAGEVVLLERHIERLISGCQQLAINGPSAFELKEQLNLVAAGHTLATLKVMITAGSGGRGYSRQGLSDNATNVIVMVFDFPSQYQELAINGINLANSKQQVATSPMLAGLKHLNRLEQVMLRAELDKRTEDDLVVTDTQGYVIEVTAANLFYWRDEQLCTPELLHSGVNGIIRQVILATIPNVLVCKTQLSDLEQANAIFICNSLMGILPVKTYNKRILTIDKVISLQKQLEGLI